jgi:hypothetical protein
VRAEQGGYALRRTVGGVQGLTHSHAHDSQPLGTQAQSSARARAHAHAVRVFAHWRMEGFRERMLARAAAYPVDLSGRLPAQSMCMTAFKRGRLGFGACISRSAQRDEPLPQHVPPPPTPHLLPPSVIAASMRRAPRASRG